MLSIEVELAPFLKRRIVWFSSKPRIWNCFATIYKQSAYCKPVPGYKRDAFYTKIIDLTQDEKLLQEGFKKNTSYEVGRAVRDGVVTSIESCPNTFRRFYNLFAQTKNLNQISASKLRSYGPNLIITKAVYQDLNVVMHSYVIDPDLKRVRLLHTASLYRNEDNAEMRSVIGRANRLLHFMDMRHFKSLGYIEYDLGGYALNTRNKILDGINKFKDGFGGVLREESDYSPYLFVLISRLLNR